MRCALILLSCLFFRSTTLGAQTDCDGIPPVEFYQSVFLCDGDTLYVGGVKLTQAGSFQTQLTTTAGCDSIVYSTIELRPSYDQLTFRALCPGDTFRGQPYARDTLLVERFLTAAGCDSIRRYELDVIEGPTTGIAGADRICQAAATTLTAPPGYATYAWNTGATTPTVEATPGDYRVTLTNSIGCAFELRRTVIGYAPLSEVDWRSPGCPGAADGSLEILLTTGGLAPYTYELEGLGPPASDTLFADLPADDYRLRVTDALGCTELIEFTLAPPTDVEAELLGIPTTPVELGDTLPLQLVSGTSFTQLRWQAQGLLSCFDCPAPRWIPGGDGSISYTATTATGCELTGTFRVELVDPLRVYFPNAFSPNGDDQNDHYQIGAAENVVAIADWQVYDRWGALMDSASGVPPDATLWDGRVAGRDAPAGVYAYAATLVFANGCSEIFSGTIHLLR